MKTVAAFRSWHVIVMVVVVASLVVNCTSSTPVPTPTPTIEPTAVPTPEPSPTPIPPTATSTATATPDPRPSLSHLMFADNPNMTNAQSYGAKFNLGIQTIYVALDFANLPAKSWIKWTLTRDHYDVLDKSEYLTLTTGSLVRVLIDNPRLLLPGNYHLRATVGKLTLLGDFVVDAASAKPGTTLMIERFDNNDLAWNVYSDAYGAVRVDQGQMLISVIKADSYANSVLPIKLGDFDVSVAVERTAGPRDGYYGVLFRYASGQGYVFQVSDNGYFNIATQTPQNYFPLIKWTRSAAIKSGGVNSLRVVVKGVKFAFYINDQQVAALNNAEFFTGSIGLVAGDFEQAGMQVAFDNLLVTVPEDEALVAVPTKAPTKVSSTPGPKPTAPQPTTAGVSTSTLLNAIVKARLAAEDVGGALDRLYGGSGAEGCGPLLADYAVIARAPTFDVSAQPANVQNAYGLYRQGVELLIVRLAPIAKVCLGGGGGIGKLDFDMARTAINEGASLLTQAQNAIGQ